jgi:hypothetical protein
LELAKGWNNRDEEIEGVVVVVGETYGSHGGRILDLIR